MENSTLSGMMKGFFFGLAFAIILFFLVGCGSTVMRHPTKTSIDNDNYYCTQVAERRAATWSGHDMPNPFLYRDFLYECLDRKGWKKVKQ